jgi:hypothetical protein
MRNRTRTPFTVRLKRRREAHRYSGWGQTPIVAHQDEPHPHVYVTLNRVSPEDGRMLSSSNEKLNLSRWAESCERARGKILCEERVANNQARDMLGEFTRAVKDRPRHLHEQKKGLAKSNQGQKVKDQQRGKDAALAAKGREMHKRHRTEWGKLRADHADCRAASIFVLPEIVSSKMISQPAARGASRCAATF